jgi:hypothetical protein
VTSARVANQSIAQREGSVQFWTVVAPCLVGPCVTAESVRERALAAQLTLQAALLERDSLVRAVSAMRMSVARSSAALWLYRKSKHGSSPVMMQEQVELKVELAGAQLALMRGVGWVKASRKAANECQGQADAMKVCGSDVACGSVVLAHGGVPGWLSGFSGGEEEERKGGRGTMGRKGKSHCTGRASGGEGDAGGGGRPACGSRLGFACVVQCSSALLACALPSLVSQALLWHVPEAVVRASREARLQQWQCCAAVVSEAATRQALRLDKMRKFQLRVATKFLVHLLEKDGGSSPSGGTPTRLLGPWSFRFSLPALPSILLGSPSLPPRLSPYPTWLRLFLVAAKGSGGDCDVLTALPPTPEFAWPEEWEDVRAADRAVQGLLAVCGPLRHTVGFMQC